MKHHLRLTSGFFILISVMSATANAQVFDTDFGALIMNQNLGAMNTYNHNMDRLRSESDAEKRRRGSVQQRTSSSGAIPDDVLDRTQAAALANLQGEYKRRVSSYGAASANQWMNSAAREVGRRTGALGPEYLRRVRSQGRDQAANWYEAQARDISRRYVENSR